MPKIKGILGTVEGSLDELSFYKRDGSAYVRKKGGVAGERIANDPAYKRTRENNAEFGMQAKAGKLIRDCVNPMVEIAGGPNLTGRLVQVMSGVKKLDASSERGERTVAIGIASPGGKSLLKGFELNQQAPLSSIVSKPYTLNPATGVITIANFVAGKDVSAPTGATHVVFQSAWAVVDFEEEVFETEYSNEVRLPINQTVQNVVLTPAAVPGLAGGVGLIFLSVTFVVETNGFSYPLNNKGHNALKIVDVL